MSQPISLTDLHRILLGTTSAGFLFEVFLRTLVAYVAIIAAIRILGARVAGQFTLFEVSVAVTIAAAVGGPLQSADRGMLPALVMIVVLIALQHVLARLGMRNRLARLVMTSRITLLVKDGELQLRAMRNVTISREQIYANLRSAGCLQLGEIARLYMEPSGKFTIVHAHKEMPGLGVAPLFDEQLRRSMRHDGSYACDSCGHVQKSAAEPSNACPVCHACKWQHAVLMTE